MNNGEVVEQGDSDALYSAPQQRTPKLLTIPIQRAHLTSLEWRRLSPIGTRRPGLLPTPAAIASGYHRCHRCRRSQAPSWHLSSARVHTIVVVHLTCCCSGCNVC